MLQQARTRQPDETICFRCDSIVKRDAECCPNCGSPIAAGPAHAAATPLQLKGQAQRAAAVAGEADASLAAAPAAGEDVVGAGRYILNFLLAGFIGLIITYFLRRQGWLATWICIPISIIVAVLVVSAR